MIKRAVIHPAINGLPSIVADTMPNSGTRRRYPWGDEPNPENSNYSDTNIGTTSVVGCFIAEASPYGCEEMSGNVWEWQRSAWGDDFVENSYSYPYNPTDGREDPTLHNKPRVLRGGAFFNNVRFVRCASRLRYGPDSLNRNNGFRGAVMSVSTFWVGCPRRKYGAGGSLPRRGVLKWRSLFAPDKRAYSIGWVPRFVPDPTPTKATRKSPFLYMYAQLTSWDNLVLAFRKAAKGKRGQPNVAAFEYAPEENLWAIQQELQTFTYRPGAYDSFYIHEPKRRLISAAPFRDRVVHHALCNLIEPIFERSFIFDRYANRIGKGTHRAIARCQYFACRYRYALKCDVRQFFPSIDHAILREQITQKINDINVLWLVDQILASGRGVLREQYTMIYFAGDDLLAPLRPRGLPIGNLTSQFWANVYLNNSTIL